MMAAAPIEEARLALAILANSPDGADQALLVYGHGFKRQTLAGLVRAGFATVERDADKTGDQTREVTKMRITQAGRDALAKSWGNVTEPNQFRRPNDEEERRRRTLVRALDVLIGLALGAIAALVLKMILF
jgi:hypothetical protein